MWPGGYAGSGWEVTDMLSRLMYPRIGWIILHVLAVIITFLLGYSIRFGYS